MRPDTDRFADLAPQRGIPAPFPEGQGLEETKDLSWAPARAAQRTLVLAAQTELARITCYAGPIDGNLNTKTIDAIQTYARQINLQWSRDIGQVVVAWLKGSHSGKSSDITPVQRHRAKSNHEGLVNNCASLTERARIGDLKNEEYGLLREACR